ncbi:MAG: uracil-DNA glycosylase [Patescibacteria group bacterium]
MKKIKDEILNLVSSPLYAYRVSENNFPVIGEGSHEAKIMFVGEAPGKNEAKTGKPFCGASGKILDQLLVSANIKREEVYVTNVVKDRPPGNRDPEPVEIDLYGPFLDKQIDIIQPKVIATLGRFSMAYIMKKFALEQDLTVISKIHGKIYKTSASYGELVVIPLFHPAVAVYDRSKLEDMKKDFSILKNFYNETNPQN